MDSHAAPRSTRRCSRPWRSIAPAFIMLLCSIIPPSPNLAQAAPALLEPAQGVFFGVSLDPSVSLLSYRQTAGVDPAMFSITAKFPIADSEMLTLQPFLHQVSDLGAMVMLTLEPTNGLESVTDVACLKLVQLLGLYEQIGMSFLLRFGEEMNGNWYPWGQKPTSYKQKFVLLSTYVKQHTCRSAMVWATANGAFYPYTGGQYQCVSSATCSDFSVLDTNGDGKLDMKDDMYTPYYPGDDAVDWVAQSIFHFGNTPPWGANVVPEGLAFYRKLTGQYVGADGDQSGIPSFYGLFCADGVHNKPMMVPETAALYNPDYVGGASEIDIKSAWWKQLFNVQGGLSVASHLPKVKSISWFDKTVEEANANGSLIDWTFSNNPSVKSAFIANLEKTTANGEEYWKFLPDFRLQQGFVDASKSTKNILLLRGNDTIWVRVPATSSRSEIGLELLRIGPLGTIVEVIGSGSIVIDAVSAETRVPIFVRYNTSSNWTSGTLYYGAWRRSLSGNTYNRSSTCQLRSPLYPVFAERGNAFENGGLIVVMFGWETFAVCLAVVLLLATWLTLRRQTRFWFKMSDLKAGAFRYAAAQGKIAILEEVSKCCFFNVDCAMEGFTALHAAAIQGQVWSAQWLLDHGASVTRKKKDKWKDSVLHYAAANGHMAVVKLLLSHGADPEATNFHGATPGDLALAAGHAVVADHLTRCIQDPSLSNIRESVKKIAVNRRTPFFAAFHRGSQINVNPEDLKTLASSRALHPKVAVPKSNTNGVDLYSTRTGGYAIASGDLNSPIDCHQPPHLLLNVDCGSLTTNFSLEVDQIQEALSQARFSGSRSLPNPNTPNPLSTQVYDSKIGEFSQTSASSAFTGKLGAPGHANTGASNGYVPSGPLSTPGASLKDVKAILERGFEGEGTPGTRLKRGTHLWRCFAVICQATGVLYFCWRSIRSFNADQVWLSTVFFVCELICFLPSFVFCLEVWSPIEREERFLSSLGFQLTDYPTVDVYIVCYNEPVDIIEATICASINLKYPASRLSVHVLDDGAREEVKAMCHKIEFQRRWLARKGAGKGQPPVFYTTRTKVPGVPHHAKAGNINSVLLKGGGSGRRPGDYVVVFDCDMIAAPHFLDKAMGHFCTEDANGKWQFKNKVAFLQTPQDFYNVGASDPMGHRAAFFYGPMMQGRDGVGGCPSVGTGVIFNRDALISVGGQAYGSITEDYNSAMALLSAGFASMYLNERLIYGLAPDDIESVLKQRLRWAMGSLQILCRDNPLLKPGLTLAQALLFFQSAFQYLLSLPVLLMCIVPLLYLFASIPPIYAPIYEFCAFFFAYFAANRLMFFYAHRGVPNKGLEMWRGSQMYLWNAPNSLWACWKVLTTEIWIFKLLGSASIGFAVTKKSATARSDWKKALGCVWMFLLYYVALLGGTLYNVLKIVKGELSVMQMAAQAVALAWGLLVCWLVWPPVSTLLPFLHVAGGKVVWEEVQEVQKRHSELWSTLSSPLGRTTARMRRRSFVQSPPATSASPTNLSRQSSLNVAANDSVPPQVASLSFDTRMGGMVLPNVLPSIRTNVTKAQLATPSNSEELSALSPHENPKPNFGGQEPTRAIGQIHRSGQLARPPRVIESVISECDVDALEEINILYNLATGGAYSKSAPLHVTSPLADSSLGRAMASFRTVTEKSAQGGHSGYAIPGFPSAMLSTNTSCFDSTPMSGELSQSGLLARIPEVRHANKEGMMTSGPSATDLVAAEKKVPEFVTEITGCIEEGELFDASMKFDSFRVYMTTRLVYSDTASLMSEPKFELHRPTCDNYLFVIINGIFLAAFVVGGTLYTVDIAHNTDWFGIHSGQAFTVF